MTPNADIGLITEPSDVDNGTGTVAPLDSKTSCYRLGIISFQPPLINLNVNVYRFTSG
jgi:hypothetical protein